jgi:hypothetical protein
MSRSKPIQALYVQVTIVSGHTFQVLICIMFIRRPCVRRCITITSYVYRLDILLSDNLLLPCANAQNTSLVVRATQNVTSHVDSWRIYSRECVYLRTKSVFIREKGVCIRATGVCKPKKSVFAYAPHTRHVPLFFRVARVYTRIYAYIRMV